MYYFNLKKRENSNLSILTSGQVSSEDSDGVDGRHAVGDEGVAGGGHEADTVDPLDEVGEDRGRLDLSVVIRLGKINKLCCCLFGIISFLTLFSFFLSIFLSLSLKALSLFFFFFHSLSLPLSLPPSLPLSFTRSFFLTQILFSS